MPQPLAPHPIHAQQRRPLMLDLFCGKGGWTVSAQKAGWHCIGYDNTDHGYPGRLMLRALPCPVAELASWQPDLIVASPPCEQYARRHLPWLNGPPPDLTLMRWALTLPAQMPCPVIIECSRFAARYFPGARFTGSYALWGDVPALLPDTPRRKQSKSGRNPAARAMIEPALAEWIATVFRE